MAFLNPVRRGVCLLLCAVSVARADGPAVDEYQVKAAFLFNFAKFVEWPPDAFSSPNDPIGICIFGRSPFGSSLEEAVRGKTVGVRLFTIHVVSTTQQAAKCQILFAGGTDHKRLQSLLQDLKGSSVLTVGECEDFTSSGGIINFVVRDARVRIDINTRAAEEARLRISSKLLSLAESTRR